MLIGDRFVWALDCLLVAAIVLNLVMSARLRKAYESVEQTMELIAKVRELQLAAIRHWNTHGVALKIPTDEPTIRN